MTSSAAFPFLRLNEEAVKASEWRARLDGGDIFSVGEFIPDWDYASTLFLEREIVLDIESASRQLEIPVGELDVRLQLEIGSGPGRLPRLIHHSEEIAVPDGIASIPVRVQLDGRNLSAAIFLRTSLVLAIAPAEHGPLSPRLAGFLLWSDTHRTSIEGEESRFPIEVASFREMFGSSPETNSLWYLHWTPDEWHREFHGAVRLYLNSDFGDFVSRIEQGDRTVLQMLLADVVSQITESLLREDDAEAILDSAEEGSVASQVAAWLQLAFGTGSARSARSMLESRPGNFRSVMLSIVELPEDAA